MADIDRAEYLFLVIWNAIFIVASFPGPLLAWRTRWQWKGKKDMFRTRILFIAAVAFFVQYVFQTAYWAAFLRLLDTDNGNFVAITAADIIAVFFQLIALLSIAALIFRTAISFLYNMSNDQKLGLARAVELTGFVGLILLVILAVVVWGIYVWYDVGGLSTDNDWVPRYYVYEKIAVAYEWIYFAFATIFLPIVFLQVLGRRTDRIAMLLFTFAILLIDALHVIEVVQGLVAIRGRHVGSNSNEQSRFDIGLRMAVAVCESLFYVGAMYCLAIMGMRNPKRLTGDDEPVFTPVQQQFGSQEIKYDGGALADKEHGVAELPDDPAKDVLLSKHGDGPQELPNNTIDAELPGDNEVPKPQSKLGRFFRR